MEIKIKGNSMYPTLKNGEVYEVYPKKRYATGDIVVFYYGDKFIVKRIADVEKGVYFMTPDNTKDYLCGSALSYKVTKDTILGKLKI